MPERRAVQRWTGELSPGLETLPLRAPDPWDRLRGLALLQSRMAEPPDLGPTASGRAIPVPGDAAMVRAALGKLPGWVTAQILSLVPRNYYQTNIPFQIARPRRDGATQEVEGDISAARR